MRAPATGAILLTLLVTTLAACGAGDKPAAEAPAAGATVPAGPEHQPAAMAMLPEFKAHVDSVAAHPAMLHQSMESHMAEVNGVVNAIHADMTRLGIHSDAAYESLANSVVRGSAALGTASGAEFDRLVAEHVDQMRRLVSVYEGMVAKM